MTAAFDPASTPLAGTRRTAWPRVSGYEILTLIGSGGMGVVYKARHQDLNRVVALKMLRGGALDDPEVRERFRAEAAAVARLQHTNIIQVFEVGTADARPGEEFPPPFISLEYVEGGSLLSLTESPQPPRYVAGMVAKLARAADAAHQVGVVHRDLKPANVLLTKDGEPKLADFGVAKQFGPDRDATQEALTQTGTAVGTPEYMAPEQVLCADAGPAIDVYALGVMLYELLTGRLPFQGSNTMETLELVLHQEPVPPRRLQPGLPRDLETICLRCLEKAPERRYPSAAALADDLTSWLEGRTIRARPVGPVERTTRWVKRNPTVAALAAGVLFVALAGVGGVVWKWRDAQAHADAAGKAADVAREHAHAERGERYRANIVAAASALQVHNVGPARGALDAAPEEHRNWEWRYFAQQLDVSRETLIREPEPFWSAEFTPDRRHLCLKTSSNKVAVWDLFANKEVASYVRADEMAWSTLSPDGRRLAYRTENHTIVLRDVASGRVHATLRGHEKHINSIRYSRDGRCLLTGSQDQTGRVWDAETGEPLLVLRGHTGRDLDEVAMSPDGRRLATAGAGDRTARLWDAHTGAQIAVLGPHGDHVARVEFNAQGDRLATIEHFPGCRVRLWDVETGGLVQTLNNHRNQVTNIAFSPDGSRLVTASRDQTLCLLDGRTGIGLAVLTGHRGWVNNVTFNASGTRIASASQDQTVRLWDAKTGDALAVLHGHSNEVLNVGFSADGETLRSGSRDGTFRTWDVRRVEQNDTLRGHSDYVYSVAFHPDGRRVASAAWDGTARVWDADTGRELVRLDHGDKVIVAAVAIHPAGKLLATRSRDDALRLWDVNTGREVCRWKVRADNWRDTRVAFSPRGDLLATGEGATVRLFDVTTRAEVAVLRKHRDVIRDVTFSPDGRWLATAAESGDKYVIVWDVNTWEVAHVLEGHSEVAYAVAFSPDGKCLASGSSDGTVRLWDPSTGANLAVLKHGTNVYGLAFSPDGTRLATGCADNTIRFWDTTKHQEVAELRGHGQYVHAIAFSPDGTRLVSASGDRTVRVWDTLRPQQRDAGH